MKKFAFLLVLPSATLLWVSIVLAAPFDTGFITWTQPNSVTFTARFWGDEFEWWFETQSGYRIILGADGWYYYAKLGTNGDFVPDTLKVGINSPPSYSHQLERTQQCLENINQQIQAFMGDVSNAYLWFKQKQDSAGSNPVVLNIGVIFVEFEDVKHYNPGAYPRIGGYLKSDFDSMMFSCNYWFDTTTFDGTPHPENDKIFGSMRDYFYQISRGKLILTGKLLNPPDANGVPRWVTIGNRSSYDYPAFMNGDAINAYNDSSQNDPGNWPSITGYDRLVFIHAQNDNPQLLLTHAGNCTFIQVPERMGKELFSSENLAFVHMGTYCHEFSHDIGMYDEYEDRDPGKTDLLNYDLMAQGIYNGPLRKGECPATLSPYLRIRYNWISSMQLTSNTANLILSYNYSNPQVYRIDPDFKTYPNEHYLIETRLREGFDAYLPNSPQNLINQTGLLLIWHHDSGINGYLKDRCDIKFADNTRDDNSFLTDFFPNNATTNNQSMTGTTSPQATVGWTYFADSSITSEQPANFSIYGIRKQSNGTTLIDSISLRLPISQNTTWSKYVYIYDNLTISNGATLTIMPGTNVVFNEGKSLTVYGTLSAEGTSSNRITFTSSNPTPSPGSWWGIRCLDGGPHTLKYCDIKYARVGLELNDQTMLLNDMVYDTISQSEYAGVDVYSNSTDHTALKLDHCVVKDNGTDGVSVTNARVQISYSRIEGNGTQNWGSGIYASDNGRIYLDHSRIKSDLLSGAEVSGEGSRISLSADEVSHGYNTFEQHGMSELYIHNDATALLGYTYIQTCDCGEAMPIKGSSPIYRTNSDPGQEPECPEGCDPVYIVHDYAGWNNVYNTYSYTGRLIYNATPYTIPARYNYWGSGSNMFYGNVDTTYHLSSAVSTPAKAQFGGYATQESPTTQSRPNMLQWLKQLRKDIEGNKENAVDALYQIALHAGPGGEYSEALSARWEDFLAALENSPKVVRAKKLTTVLRLQAKQDQGEYANAITMADQVLQRNNIGDDMWFYSQSRKVFAAVGMGNISLAQSYYNAMQSRGERIDKKATEALRRYVALAIESASSGSDRGGGFIKPAEATVSTLPKSYAIEQNYPNPFNPTTTIRYSLPLDAKVTLKIYDVLGREVRTLVNGVQAAGYKTAELDASTIASGVYFYRLEANSIGEMKDAFTQVKKMLLLK